MKQIINLETENPRGCQKIYATKCFYASLYLLVQSKQWNIKTMYDICSKFDKTKAIDQGFSDNFRGNRSQLIRIIPCIILLIQT